MASDGQEMVYESDKFLSEFAKGKKSLTMGEYLKAFGPGAIMAASIIGPGSVTTASVMGAKYGYQAIWVLALAALFAYFFQEPALRITLFKKKSLTEGIREEIGKPVAGGLYLAVLAGAVAFQAGNFAGAGMALHYVFPFLSIFGWACTMAFAALVVCWFGVYKLIENVNRLLIGLMILAFVITAFYSGPSIGKVVTEGFSFKIPGGDYWLLLALLSTTMPPNIPLGFSAFLKKKYSNESTPSKSETSWFELGKNLSLARFDLRTNMIITGLISVAIVICAGTVIHPQGIEIKGAGDMAMQLTPLLGRFAGILFALGLWGAGFSSGIYQISIQTPIFNDAMGWVDDAKALRNRILMIIAGIAPVGIVYLFQKVPVAIIITAQALNGLALPIITAVIWKLCRKESFMGALVNRNKDNTAYGVIMVLVSFLAIRVFLRLIGVL